MREKNATFKDYRTNCRNTDLKRPMRPMKYVQACLNASIEVAY